MEIKGKITAVLPVVSGTKKDGGTWSKQSFVITEETDKYPKSLCFEVWNDKVAIQEGEVCTIHFETKASEYNSKWYNEVRCWKKEGGKSALEQTNTPASAPVSAPPTSAPAPSPAPVAAPTPAPAAKGGKLTMAANVFEASAQKIAAEGDSGKQTEILNALKEKYDMTQEQIDTLDNLFLPF